MTNLLYIKPKAIMTGGHVLEESVVLVEGERITAVGPTGEVRPPAGAKEVDAGDLLLAPGSIDLQFNGAFGFDFTITPSAIWEVAQELPAYGVTAFLPTIITSPPEAVEAAQEVISIGPPAGFTGAVPLGLHLEGPFINPAKRGAHNPAYLRLPDPSASSGQAPSASSGQAPSASSGQALEAIASWSPQMGVRLVTLAPELPGALDLVRALVERGVVVSAGHSTATLEEAKAGMGAGITYGTHLFNAMPPLDHREPGLAGALLGVERITAGMIVDGIHVHPDLVALSWRLKGPAHLNLITDSMAAVGKPPGTYKLGDLDVIVDGKSARLADGRLAGSLLTMDQAVRNLITFTGCQPAEAVATVTSVPASLLGLSTERGRIAPGLRADLTLFTPEMAVAATYIGGKLV